jgi:hypothetical protein
MEKDTQERFEVTTLVKPSLVIVLRPEVVDDDIVV